MRTAVLAAFLWVLFAAPAAHAQPRVALVVGNANYDAPGWSLANPLNDAALVAGALEDVGFDVARTL